MGETDVQRRQRIIATKPASDLEKSLRHMQNEVYLSHSAVALQARRIRANENPAAEYMVDLRLLVLAANDVRRASAGCIDLLTEDEDKDFIREALERFDEKLAGLDYVRNALEHSDEYLLGSGRHQLVEGMPEFQRYVREPDTPHRIVVGDISLEVDDIEQESLILSTAAYCGVAILGHARNVRSYFLAGVSRFDEIAAEGSTGAP